MPQTTYLTDRAIAVAGQLADGGNDIHIATWPASEVIPFGLAVEVVSGKVRLPQSTGQEIATFGGVAMYKDMAVPGGYAIGDMVPVLRKGRIWGVGSSTLTGATELEDAKVSHSSTVATDRGKFTDAASAATAGSEISGVVAKFRGSKSTTALVLVELNLPSGGVQ